MKLYKNNKGSITLEAALILPFFIAFIILLICLIKLSISQIALQTAVSETTKLIANNVYPVSKTYDFLEKHTLAELNKYNDDIVTTNANIPPIPVDSIIENIDKTFMEEALLDFIKQKSYDIAGTILVQSLADKSKLDVDKIKVKVNEFDFPPKNDGHIIMEASYTFRLPVPFLKNNEITLKARAAEKMWL